MDASKEEYKILILPDHRTPVELRTHSSEPVPYVLFDSTKEQNNPLNKFTERAAYATGNFFDAGHKLMTYLIKGK